MGTGGGEGCEGREARGEGLGSRSVDSEVRAPWCWVDSGHCWAGTWGPA